MQTDNALLWFAIATVSLFGGVCIAGMMLIACL